MSSGSVPYDSYPNTSLSSSLSSQQNVTPAVVYALPHSDENAPDLYLPSMSLISYVLLCALCYGNAGKFNPEVFSNVATTCIVAQIVEVLLMLLACYSMQVPTTILDLLSITGYKYLGLCGNLLLAMFIKLLLKYKGRSAYYACFAWTASAAAFFMLKTITHHIPTVTSPTGPKREWVILSFAMLQFAFMWFLSRTNFF